MKHISSYDIFDILRNQSHSVQGKIKDGYGRVYNLRSDTDKVIFIQQFYDVAQELLNLIKENK